MLAALQIRDIVLIDRLDLTLAQGLTALTGETGAGKSIILDSLGLALGTKADRALLRNGARQGQVTAVFEIPADHMARGVAAESGIEAVEGPVILRRVIAEDGRSRCFVNDAPVSLTLLRTIGDTLVEIHGQHDARGLLDAASHRDLLDAYGHLEPAAELVATAHAHWVEAREALETHEAHAAAAAAKTEDLAFALSELDALKPEPGEEARLAEDRAVLSHAEKISEAFADATSLISRDGGISARLAQAMRRLERIADKAAGRLEGALEALDRAAVEAAEAEAVLETVAQELIFDPRRLEQIEERLFALRAMARKHGVAVDDLSALRDDLARKVAVLEDSAGQGQRLRVLMEGARTRFEAAARSLGENRAAAARKLDKAVNRELKPLKLDKATFATRIEPVEPARWGVHGAERVSFEIATNPGAPMGPLIKIASGGELARFVLALKVVLARRGAAAALIFDEVDQGVGGAVAAAVGERLSVLAREAQVLVVTHSPQVAARADHHFKIAKSGAGSPVTRVEELNAATRREEIARMLSGAEVSDEARAAADRLLREEDRAARKAARA